MKVTEIGRLFFIVESRSRFWLSHFVDLEPGNHPWGNNPFFCTCEDFKFNGNRPCGHIKACAEYMLPIILHNLRWKKALPPVEIKTNKRQYKIKNEPTRYVAKPNSRGLGGDIGGSGNRHIRGSQPERKTVRVESEE